MIKTKNPDELVESLKNGKIAIFPTDTAYGIGCRIDNTESVRKLFEVRNRPENKPMLALVSNSEMAEQYLQPLSSEVRSTMKKYWPGGLTLILYCNKVRVPSVVRANGETLAVRMPDHKIMRAVIEKVGVPILAPSANMSGGQTPFELSDVDSELLEKVDLVFDGECTLKGQSTIIDCSANQWKTVREGVVKLEL
jgi:L-threonylcarbamoyladenylate synthase